MGSVNGTRRKRGRPPKFSEAIADEICRLVEVGNYLETAALCCGVGHTTVRRWLRDGKRQKTGQKHEFWTAYKKAEGRAQGQALARIRRAGGEHWQAEAWFLERKWPDKWGRRERREVTGKGGGPIEYRDAAAAAKHEIEAALGLYADDDTTSS